MKMIVGEVKRLRQKFCRSTFTPTLKIAASKYGISHKTTLIFSSLL